MMRVFGLTNPVGTGGWWNMCLCLGCGGVGRVGGMARVWVSGVMLCLCVL